MVRYLTTAERAWVVNEFAKTSNKCQVVRNWPFPSPRPSRSGLIKLLHKFETHGSVHNLKSSGRPRSVLTALNTGIVDQVYLYSPRNSVRRTSAELGIGTSSVFRILKVLNKKAYLPTLVQSLSDGDFVNR